MQTAYLVFSRCQISAQTRAANLRQLHRSEAATQVGQLRVHFSPHNTLPKGTETGTEKFPTGLTVPNTQGYFGKRLELLTVYGVH